MPDQTQTHTVTFPHGTELTECLYEPGDATCYRITWVQVRPLGTEPPQHLVTIATRLARSMYLDLGPGCYLHPTYAAEKLGPDSGSLAKVLSHFVNMRFCSTYDQVLQNLLDAGPEDRFAYLPTPFVGDEALSQELHDFRLHNFRHHRAACIPTAESILAANPVLSDPELTSETLRWACVRSTVESDHPHLPPDQQAQLVGALMQLLSPSPTP